MFLGLIRITFPGYTHDQLIRIIESRLQGVDSSAVDRDAIQFASRKVAAVSGDARRALEICRRAVEIAEQDREIPMLPDPPQLSEQQSGSVTARPKVTIKTIKEAIKEATSSSSQQLLKNLPLLSRILMMAIVRRYERISSPATVTEIFAEVMRYFDSVRS